MEFDQEYVCALSGMAAKTDELVEDAPDGSPTEDLPVGWIQVTVTRREVNPAWLEIQAVKAQTLQGALSQLPEDQRVFQQRYLAIQIEASFSALEARISKYLDDAQTAYVSDPQDNPAVQDALNQVMGVLELEGFEFAEEEEPEEASEVKKIPEEGALPQVKASEPPEPPEPDEPPEPKG